MRALFLSTLAVLLAACAAGGSRVESTNPTITYRYAQGEEDAVEDQADEYCEDFDRNAILADVDTEGSVNVATYECVGAD